MKAVRRSIDQDLVDYYISKDCSTEKSYIYSSRLNSKNKDSVFFDLSLLSDISSIKDIMIGSEVIADAIHNNENIVAITDYDSDGCHSAAVIYRSFKEMGCEELLTIMTPDRMIDGYGANPRLVNEAHKINAKVIITADNGISAFAAVDRAVELGIKVVVTDHHLVAERGLPNASAVIDPAREDCGWQDGICCGASIAFFTMVKVKDCLNNKYDKTISIDVMRMFQLVGAATIADCVPLIGINRSLVIQGLSVLENNPYAGYKALLEEYGVKRVDEQVIGFKVGPAINSAGRLGSAAPSISFLATDDGAEASAFASKLISSNKKRKDIQEEVVARVMAELESRRVFEDEEDFLVFGDEEWHHGVVGIVSSRVSDKTMKPSIVFGGQVGNDVLKGSGRSGESGLHMKDCFDKIAFKYPDLLIAYGGHSAAAGCSIKSIDFEKFRDACKEIGTEMLSGNKSVDVLVDGIIDFDDYNSKFETSAFECLMAGPFGQKFPMPEFCIKNIPTSLIKPLGKDKKHIRFNIEKTKVIGFNCATDIKSINSHVDVVVSPSYNYFNGSYQRQFVIQRVL